MCTDIYLYAIHKPEQFPTSTTRKRNKTEEKALQCFLHSPEDLAWFSSGYTLPQKNNLIYRYSFPDIFKWKNST